MPMQWSAEADAKLMSLIMKMCAIKITNAQMVELAAEMGPDCTAKAISHRLAKLRGSNASASRGEAAQDSPSSKKKTAAGGPAKRKITADEAGQLNGHEEAGQNGETDGSPSKKVKGSGIKKAAKEDVVKDEDDDSDSVNF